MAARFVAAGALGYDPPGFDFADLLSVMGAAIQRSLSGPRRLATASQPVLLIQVFPERRVERRRILQIGQMAEVQRYGF